jgi:integrase
MRDTTKVLEPTFADAIAAVTATADLPVSTRQQWCSALRSLARCLSRPVESIPARFSAVRNGVLALRYPPFGWTTKTLANVKSNAKSALLWFAEEKGIPRDGVPMTPAWAKLHAGVTDRSTRYRLAPLMRFCSAAGILPTKVDDQTLQAFMQYRERTSTRGCDEATRRVLVKLWNACIGTIEGWPIQALTVPPTMGRGGLTWDDMPAGWRQDVEAYLDHLTRIRRNKKGDRIRPCKESTIITRKRELIAAAKVAIAAGMPIESLFSLAAMLQPEVANKIIDAYWQADGEVPSTYTISLAGRFEAVARQMNCLSADQLERLGDLRYALEPHREEGMTEKNLAVVRMVLTPGVWERFANLPDELLKQARAAGKSAPVRAALLAQTAVALGILLIAPIRLGNLASIRLDLNLIRPGGPDTDYWLRFPKYDVKNNRAIQFRLDSHLTKLIEEYVFDFRPALMKGNNDQVTKATGIRMTVHQYRHAAAAIILKHRPGEYELVRQALGHKSIETTKRFYIDLETTAANEIYTEIIRRKLQSPNPDDDDE